MERDSEDILNRRWRLRGNFNKQLSEILHTVRMSRLKVEGLQILYDDIQRTFSKIWPGCSVKAFGSIVTGLALKSSDVDCFLELPAHCDDDPVDCVQRSRDLIADGRTPFREASAIIKKVPIVQFLHAKTGRRCDLSFDGPIAVEFGKLAGYLLGSDERALKLAVIIKCWARVRKLTGKKLLPSNALIVLIVCFLQYKEILPPVCALQNSSSAKVIDGWDTAFTEVTYDSRNGASVYNLLRQFFAYYRDFNFRDSIVCPYLGHPVERREFRSGDGVPSAFRLYKENVTAGVCKLISLNCIICIQDPFDHSRNIAGHVRPQAAGEIVRHFREAADVFANTSGKGVLGKLLSYRSREPERSEYGGSWNPPISTRLLTEPGAGRDV